MVKNPSANAGDFLRDTVQSMVGEDPGEGHGHPLQCSWLENSMDRGAGWLQSAAAAKSLQSCPTLCNPRDGCPPGSPVPGILV